MCATPRLLSSKGSVGAFCPVMEVQQKLTNGLLVI